MPHLSRRLADARSIFQVMQDVAYEPDTTQTTLHITDYTSNALFLPNDLDDFPNGERIKFTLTAFAPERQKQISHLKQGQRVFLRNVRVKCGISSDLEGDIGAKGNFAVTMLSERDTAYKELEKAYVMLFCDCVVDPLTLIAQSARSASVHCSSRGRGGRARMCVQISATGRES